MSFGVIPRLSIIRWRLIPVSLRLIVGSIQTVYNWCNGLNMPTIDNLYALSQLLRVPIDVIICGNRKTIMSELVVIENARDRRLYTYYKKINEMLAA